jgi:hypothetical protein
MSTADDLVAGIVAAGIVMQGPRGERGPAGARGPQGERGVPGPVGDTGRPGDDGRDGSASTTPGPKGDRGVPGPAGERGLAGRDGAPGRDGQTAPRVVRAVIERGPDRRMTAVRQFFEDGTTAVQSIKRGSDGLSAEVIQTS